MTVLRVALAFVVLLAFPASALAGQVKVETGVIVFTGVGAENVSFSFDDVTHLIDSDKPMTLGGLGPCTLPSPNQASCTGSAFNATLIGADNALDASKVSSGAAVTVTGSPGNDNIIGTPAGDTIAGEAGDDGLTGGDGNDTISGGAGANTIEDGPGNDYVTGGPQNDTFNVGTGTDLIFPATAAMSSTTTNA